MYKQDPMIEALVSQLAQQPRIQDKIGGGGFAAVIPMGPLDLALTTDGVGTKLLVAEYFGNYSGVGIDCVAMNVNDLLCVGATPMAMLDYIAYGKGNPDIFRTIGQSLAHGAQQAGISIVGGETAEVPEMVRGVFQSSGGLDLVGMAVGIVEEGRLLDGSQARPGDAVIGVTSSGLHANGYTLARRALAPFLEDPGFREILGEPLSASLLRPTRIYVRHVKALREAGIKIHALAHITGGGLLNLSRVKAYVGFEISLPPPIPPIFRVIWRYSEMTTEEMYSTFNMGVGMAVTVPAEQAQEALRVIWGAGADAYLIGRVVPDSKRRVSVKGKLLPTT